MSFTDQPRVRLATLPTPLHPLDNLTRRLDGPRIFIKRDDLTGLAFGGNKTRKLEYLVADAKAQGATHLITEGGVQSNHVRQTAAAARLVGMRAVLVLNGPDAEPSLQGNLLLDRLLGAEWHVVPTGGDRKPKMQELAEQLRRQGDRPYVIPTGGSNGIGALGYVAATLELHEQFWAAGVSPKCLYLAWGSGGTHAGMALGAAMFTTDFRVKAYMVVPGGADEGRGEAMTIIEEATRRLDINNPLTRDDLWCDDSQLGEGYGVATPAGLDAIRLLAQTEGILLDPVYSAKAFAGMIADIEAGAYQKTDTVVFLHTGGTPALFAKVDQLRPILGE